MEVTSMHPFASSSQPAILVVEDNQTLAEMYSFALGRQGFAVSVAHNAQDAWDAANRLQPAVILLDIDLGGSNGLDLLDRIKAQPAKGFPPKVVMFTNHDSPTYRARAAGLGADGFMVKANIRIKSLGKALAALLAEPAPNQSSTPMGVRRPDIRGEWTGYPTHGTTP